MTDMNNTENKIQSLFAIRDYLRQEWLHDSDEGERVLKLLEAKILKMIEELSK